MSCMDEVFGKDNTRIPGKVVERPGEDAEPELPKRS